MTATRLLPRLEVLPVVALCALAHLIGIGNVVHAQAERESATWWLSQFGSMEEDSPLALRAQGVYERVLPAANRRRGRRPTLLLLKTGRGPEAHALRDGFIMINKAALKLCYEGDKRSPEAGDARLAFLLGHELEHLARGDFSHPRSFMVRVDRNQRGRANGSGTQEILDSSEFLLARQNRELLADKAGLHTMMFAGFDPRHLFNERRSFFSEWHAFLFASGGRPTASTPSPENRETVVRSSLEELASNFDLFRFGTRLLQLQRHRDAIALLTQYLSIYPGREVLNNLGVAHYQLAAELLGACDGSLVVMYKLPLVVDAETVEGRRRLRGGGDSPCYRSRSFRDEIDLATTYLEDAAAQSPEYLAAWLNLTSAFLLGGSGAAAFNPADEAEQLAPGDPLVRTAVAIAGYHFEVLENLRDRVDEYLARFDDILEDAPELPEALYARAAILTRQKRAASAREAWQAFLNVETAGPWAGHARDRLGVKSPDPTEPTGPSCTLPGTLVAFGTPSEATRKLLASYTQGRLAGGIDGRVYSRNSVRALELGGSIELVERAWQPGMPLLNECGPPLRIVRTTLGELRVYPGVAVEIRRDAPYALVYFSKPTN